MDALKPGQGYAELTAGARGQGASIVGFARGELGWKPRSNIDLFTFGEATLARGAPPAWMAGLGARVTW